MPNTRTKGVMKRKNSSQSKTGQGRRIRSVPLQNVQQPMSWQSGANCSFLKEEKSILGALGVGLDAAN